MIISKTPFRISLFGGNTDRAEWYEENGGEVLGFSIDKFCWLTLRKLPPFFDYRHRIVYSEIELVSAIKDIKHPVVRAILQNRGQSAGLEIHHDGDLPARSGLGSSSAFTVGFLNALRAFKGHISSPKSLAEEAIHIERDVLKENVGSQDQIWAAFGGFNAVTFHRNGDFDVSPVLVSRERKHDLNARLMLVFTGFSRFSSDIAGAQIANFKQRRLQLTRIQRMAIEARGIIEDPAADLDDIGHLLHEGWELKKSLAKETTTQQIDTIYELSRESGALGGKLLGAGGGGFLLLYVPLAAQNAVRNRLENLIHVDFKIGSEGSRIVLYEPEGL